MLDKSQKPGSRGFLDMPNFYASSCQWSWGLRRILLALDWTNWLPNSIFTSALHLQSLLMHLGHVSMEFVLQSSENVFLNIFALQSPSTWSVFDLLQRGFALLDLCWNAKPIQGNKVLHHSIFKWRCLERGHIWHRPLMFSVNPINHHILAARLISRYETCFYLVLV